MIGDTSFDMEMGRAARLRRVGVSWGYHPVAALDAAEVVIDGFAALDAALAADLGRFAEWHDPERLVGNLYRALSELRGEPLGTPIDPQAYADMITYNGGRPLRCLA